ncbi:MAG: riboflavin synthase [Halobacteriovorax sp.]|nr:riboflavin synthase [Halobacteriovorax sp.]|tara:strand:+ start:356768 stop:357406 length:639 start_codon:yes stop_codon:yes gene_type:complete
MFTGIVKEIGRITNIQPNEEGKLITIDLKSLAPKANIDDSVCVNGVCQTVIEKNGSEVKFQAVGVTLEKTNFGEFQIGDKVNLETSLTASDQLGGHFVMGHVNGVSEISEVISNGDNYYTWINLPEEMKPYLVQEGSISVDGVSLTIAEVNSDYTRFAVSLIPHTWENTVFHSKKVGSKVNLEVDILAKYIENLLKHRSKSISLESLKEAGF